MSIKRTCKHCGQFFFVKPCITANIQSCSNECRLAHHIWLECPTCKKPFDARHNKDRVYCSKSCYLKSWKETRIEKAVRLAFEEANIFIHRQYQIKGIGARTFDFYAPSLNLLVEADGTYWHSKPGMQERDQRKTQKAINAGYHIERLKESVIMSPEWPSVFQAMLSKYKQLTLQLLR
jgi:very-short-patch-repair endonuclease